MDLKELDKLTISMKSIKKRHLADPAKYMKYFPDIGVSVTINQKKQVVDEILISNLD